VNALLPLLARIESAVERAAVAGVATGEVTAADCVREIRRFPLLARMAEIQKVLNRGDVRDELLAEKQRLTEELKTTA